MNNKRFLAEIRENIESISAQSSTDAAFLWDTLLSFHPADIADLFGDISRHHFKKLFPRLPKEIKKHVFQELSDKMKVYALSFMDDHDRTEALHSLPIDELTDLFDVLSDEELKIYLNLLHKKEREKVLSLLKFDPESAGGIMSTDALTLMPDYTVEKSIKLLQRLSSHADIYQQMYVVTRSHHLEGHINLEDLVLNKADARIGTFMRENQLVATVLQDQETVAKQMVHYGLMTVPVVDSDNRFVGVIPSDTLVDILVEEASEDVQKISALSPMKHPYFETSFFRLAYERGSILIVLLIAESFSGTILHAYEALLTGFLASFIPMLISTGGNTSSQTSALVIQGIASGEIGLSNMLRFLRREFLMAGFLGVIIGAVSFGRAYLMGGALLEGLVIGCSISLIVLTSVVLGSCIPFVLRRFNVDPAFSAGPFLATVMDILGVLIYCTTIRLFLA